MSDERLPNVERIDAAIDKLETLKVTSTPGLWTHVHYEGVADSRRRLMAAGDFARPMTRAEYLAPADAELIVTLHRTIDAQLETLRAGRTAHTAFPGMDESSLPGWAAEARALSLSFVDAILGDNA